MYKFLIFIATTFAVIEILHLFGVFEIVTSGNKAATELNNSKKLARKRQAEMEKLKLYTALTNAFRGILMNSLVYEKHQYYINRLELRSEPLNRLLTPEELRGSKLFPFVCSLIVIPLAIFYPFLFVVPIACFLYFMAYPTILQSQIADEDAIIDDYFIDLYLLLYSKLQQGSRARLQTTVENYIDTLQGSRKDDISKTMLKLARYMLNLLSLYEDHVAIPKLREIYHSATIINFCNVAGQALNGVENHDNLLTFRMQLIERKTEVMRKRSKALCRKGEMSIYAIYIILFIFIIVGWYSKLPKGAF